MDFFEILSIFGEMDKKAEGKPAESEDYLKRGERILSLAREKLLVREFKEDDFFENIIPKTYQKKTSSSERGCHIRSRASRYLKEKLPFLVHDGDINESFWDALFPYAPEVTLSIDNGAGAEMVEAVARSKWTGKETVLKVKVPGYEKPLFMAVGGASFSPRQNGSSYYFRRRRKDGEYTIIDGSLYFQTLFLYCQLKKRILAEKKAREMEERAESPAETYLTSLLRKQVLDACVEGNDGKLLIVLPESLCDIPEITEYLSEEGFYWQRGGETKVTEKTFFPLWFLRGKMPLRFHNGNGWTESGTSLTKSFVGLDRELLVNLFDILLGEYQEDKQEYEHFKKERDGYAKSFMTKRNIPEKVVKEMESSDFNQYFGYVEFDEEVDLVKAREICKEFLALAEFLNLKKHEEVSIRFRKLGNHHAAGLYYPYWKCLCVDIRHPDSFSHELFHMIDFEHGRLSRNADFSPIAQRYITCFDEKVKEGNVELKGKYNRAYYCEKAEIFARCAEIYLVRVCGIYNSIVKPEFGFAYPEDEKLMKMIKEYFDHLLGKEENEPLKEAV